MSVPGSSSNCATWGYRSWRWTVPDEARGAQFARELGVPLVIGDASRAETLREASIETARSLVVLSTDDVTNLEAALHARAVRPDLRVVLRLFDGDFAQRVQKVFGITSSKSVSLLAAPAFAAAILERDVIGTIPVKRRVLWSPRSRSSSVRCSPTGPSPGRSRAARRASSR